jgi:hypothetical protein
VTKNVSVSSAALPVGCSVFTKDGKTFTASFNAQASTAKCSASSAQPRVAGAATSIVTFAVDLDGAKDLATITLTGPST